LPDGYTEHGPVEGEAEAATEGKGGKKLWKKVRDSAK